MRVAAVAAAAGMKAMKQVSVCASSRRSTDDREKRERERKSRVRSRDGRAREKKERRERGVRKEGREANANELAHHPNGRATRDTQAHAHNHCVCVCEGNDVKSNLIKDERGKEGEEREGGRRLDKRAEGQGKERK